MLAQDRSDHGFRHVKGETHRGLMIGGGEASKSNMRRVQAKQAVKSSIRAVTLLSNPIVVDGLLGFDEFNNHIGTWGMARSWRFGTISGARILFSLHNNIFVRAASSYGRNHPASNAALCPTGIRWK
jgi:hypothetical protein